MKQNKYDDAHFFANYSAMPRSTGGLESAGEWPEFRALLPELRDRRVLDLGCGFGWHCRHARQHGARSVVGVDISEKMLARAQADTHDSEVVYRRCAIENVKFQSGEFDVIISSLALHYVKEFGPLSRNIFYWLATDGTFVFSVEHPIFTAVAAQQWCLGPNDERLHWPIDNYHDEGVRHTQWMADDVVKYHRTTATYVNTLVDSGFLITRLVEPTLSEEMLRRWPEWKDECRRPMFMLISAAKGAIKSA